MRYLCFLTALLSVNVMQTAPRKVAMIDSISSPLNSIVQNCETVFFAEGNLVRERAGPIYELCVPIGVLEGVFAPLGMEDSTLREQLKYVLLGARDFRSPNRLGMIPSRKVYFLELREGITLNLAYGRGVSPVAKIKGVPIWKWEVRNPETNDPDSYFLTQPVSTQIWVGTDIELLRKVLMSDGKHEQPVLHRAEWLGFDFSSSLWAVRHYELDHVKDPSAAGIELSPGHNVGRTAKAIVFRYDRQSHAAVIRYFADAVDGLIEVCMSEPSLSVGRISPSVWRITFAINDEPASRENRLFLAHLLGFGVAL